MSPMHRLFLAGSLVLGLSVSGGAAAQTTDGYHSIQVFPLVVDNASFTQRYNFRNPNTVSITIKTKYFPAMDRATPSQACNDIVIAPLKTVAVAGLRALCPNLPAVNAPVGASQFGFLYTSEDPANGVLPYAAFSRVANPQGNGFTVEAFPAHTFTSADAVINGLRRKAAVVNVNPAYQTNCFLGNLNEMRVPSITPVTTKVLYTLYDSIGNQIGASGSVDLLPGQYVRMLDIFNTVGVPNGDFDDAMLKVEENNTDPNLGEPGIISFCTVQESTTFGADFRIGKQELGNGVMAYPGDIIGAQDNHVARETLVNLDALSRPFQINAGDNYNTHVVYFRHPDWVQCELVDGAGARLALSYGLEMRLIDSDGITIAGGNDQTGFADLYLGDKTDRNDGANSRYTIQVEDAETNSGAVRSYRLHCKSGSGHTLGDLIRYKDAGDNF